MVAVIVRGEEVDHVFRWDLDKTYLHTNFDSVMDLLRTAVERPERKRTVAGAAALMREIRGLDRVRITIVSGSPEQLRTSLEAKLRLDGVRWDELVLKPNLRNILRLRFRAVREQVGYKLPTLLSARSRVQASAQETLFGDDAEADALVYSLYADVLAGRIGEDTLLAVLEKAGAYPDAISLVRRYAATLERTNPVRRIFIHLERKSDPNFFRRYGPRVVPITNYFQAALVLVADKTIPPSAGLRHAASLVIEHDFDIPDLVEAARAVVSRGHGSVEALQQIALAARTVKEPFPLVAHRREKLALGLEDCVRSVGPAVPPLAIDYLAAFADDRARWEEAKQRARREARK
ncbi:MAG: hypothetical protein Q8Q09_16230 [Deltaproteobacteria bacterium]|nr:hypothetical protein [Deltaproteobacteria bacterium]